MLGPETVTETIDGKQKPLTEILAAELTSEIEEKIDNCDCSNLAQVAQKFWMYESTTDLQYLTKNFFEKREDKKSKIHSNLASLPFYLIINATPDNFYINSLKEKRKDFIIDSYNFRGGKKDFVEMGTAEKPLIYYLYGNLHKPESMVISQNDLLDFLVAIISKSPALPNNIRSEFADRNKTFLFLGFGFQNWYLRILLHVLQGGNRKCRSFAFEQFAKIDDKRLNDTIIFFQDEYKIKFYQIEMNTFTKQLKQKFEEQSEIINDDTGIPEDSPTIFICHASEDKQQAMDLYNKLQQKGFNPWIDKENIRGGDEWDPLIKSTIKEIDYFIVMQSKALAKKKIGYVNKEIDLACKRQPEFRQLCFIIPVKIDDCKKLEELKRWQTIDITTSEGFNELFKTIKRDFQRRNI
jgi:hypothetical protein